MASVTVNCPKGTWTQVNITSKSGMIELVKGEVKLTQQTINPATLNTPRVPRNGYMRLAGTERNYCTHQAPTEFIWAYGIQDENEIDMTPDEGVR